MSGGGGGGGKKEKKKKKKKGDSLLLPFLSFFLIPLLFLFLRQLKNYLTISTFAYSFLLIYSAGMIHLTLTLYVTRVNSHS